MTKQGEITDHHFREWWRQAVPKVLAPLPSMDYLNPTAHFDEDQVKSELFAPMENFLCGIDKSKTPETPGGGQDQETQLTAEKVKDEQDVFQQNSIWSLFRCA